MAYERWHYGRPKNKVAINPSIKSKTFPLDMLFANKNDLFSTTRVSFQSPRTKRTKTIMKIDEFTLLEPYFGN